jgi:hypothetical protein
MLRRYELALLDGFHDDTLVVAVVLNPLLRRTASEDFGIYAVPIDALQHRVAVRQRSLFRDECSVERYPSTVANRLITPD